MSAQRSITILPVALLLFFFGGSVDIIAQNVPVYEKVFEKIILDGVMGYKHRITEEIITGEQLKQLYGEAPTEDVVQHNFDEHKNWNTDKVNPYGKNAVATPFPIFFDQLTYTPPVAKDMFVTSRFGRRRRGPHRGIDIDLITGEKVRSILPGKVRFVGYSSGHGKTVVVRHANEVETVYAHLSSYSIKENDVVEEGQVIGKGGATGNARGSHLHFEIRYKGVCIHPEYLLTFDGTNRIRGHELWVTDEWKNPFSHSSYSKSDVEIVKSEQEALVKEAEKPKYHKIRRGDTLYRISRTYDIPISQLCLANGISKSSILHIGKTIKIP